MSQYPPYRGAGGGGYSGDNYSSGRGTYGKPSVRGSDPSLEYGRSRERLYNEEGGYSTHDPHDVYAAEGAGRGSGGYGRAPATDRSYGGAPYGGSAYDRPAGHASQPGYAPPRSHMDHREGPYPPERRSGLDTYSGERERRPPAMEHDYPPSRPGDDRGGSRYPRDYAADYREGYAEGSSRYGRSGDRPAAYYDDAPHSDQRRDRSYIDSRQDLRQAPAPYDSRSGPSLRDDDADREMFRQTFREWPLPAHGISRLVIQKDICLYLGPDATVRGPVATDKGEMYYVRAYRALTSEQVRDLQAESARFSKNEARQRL